MRKLTLLTTILRLMRQGAALVRRHVNLDPHGTLLYFVQFMVPFVTVGVIMGSQTTVLLVSTTEVCHTLLPRLPVTHPKPNPAPHNLRVQGLSPHSIMQPEGPADTQWKYIFKLCSVRGSFQKFLIKS